jgi:L-methionine (R)-S-oxide reductase
MDKIKKRSRYQRIYAQLKGLFHEQQNPVARMATVVALLHHKMEYYFWTGFYLLDREELIVGPYQGPVACIKLKKGTGVCWAGINTGEAVVVPDVHRFPGHIACDSRSNSEIVLPLMDQDGRIVGVLDVDSRDRDSFDEVDAEELEQIMSLIFEKELI